MLTLSYRWSFQQNHVAEHKASLQWAVFLNIPIAIMHFLFEGRKEQVKAIALVELQQVRLVVGINDKVAATGLRTAR